jgi:hypothetical protein
LPADSCVSNIQDFFTAFRKCTASIKDIHDMVSSPYYAFNPQRISAGLTLFHQEFDDRCMSTCHAVGAVLPPTVHKSFIFLVPTSSEKNEVYANLEPPTYFFCCIPSHLHEV